MDSPLTVKLAEIIKGSSTVAAKARAINSLRALPIISRVHHWIAEVITFDKDQKAVSSRNQSTMSFMTDASDGNGDTHAKPVSGPKNHHNLSIVYIEHELDKSITESTEDEAANDTSRLNLTVVYIDHHLDGLIPSDNSQDFDGSKLFANENAVMQSQRGLFRLPPELRIMIWELILPGKRLLGAQAWTGTHRKAPGSRSRKTKECRWFFRVYDWELSHLWRDPRLTLKVPILLHICTESRSVALQHGQFIFFRHDGSGEAGTWWNSDLDVLVFDKSWSVHQHSWALTGLQGLEHVRSLSIDQDQAWDFGYYAGYNGNDPLGIPRNRLEVLAISFSFQETNQIRHYVLEFFPHFQQLTIFFPSIYSQLYRDYPEFHPEEHEYSVTFQLGSNIKTAEKKLRRYRKLCMRTRGIPAQSDCFFESGAFESGDSLVTDGPIYATKDGINTSSLDHVLGVSHEMCMMDHSEVPI